LSSKPASYYVTLFEAGQFQIVKEEEPSDSSELFTHYAELQIGDDTDDRYFEVSIGLTSDELPDRMRRRAALAIEKIIELDEAARSIPTEHDHHEALAYLDIRAAEVRLHYWSDTVNTEWDVVFSFDDQGMWDCLGIPDWRNPGSYTQ
ncbi:MAG: hypothetical protein AAGA22_07070, partial [Pseudomonadota bacterium]